MAVRVLIAEDMMIMRKVVIRALHQIGVPFEVVEAANGLEALDAFRLRPADLLICDISMPVMDGFELVQRLREEVGSNVPVVMISGRFTRDQALKAIGLGVRGMLCKPFTIDQVADEIEPLLTH